MRAHVARAPFELALPSGVLAIWDPLGAASPIDLADGHALRPPFLHATDTVRGRFRVLSPSPDWPLFTPGQPVMPQSMLALAVDVAPGPVARWVTVDGVAFLGSRVFTLGDASEIEPAHEDGLGERVHEHFGRPHSRMIGGYVAFGRDARRVTHAPPTPTRFVHYSLGGDAGQIAAWGLDADEQPVQLVVCDLASLHTRLFPSSD